MTSTIARASQPAAPGRTGAPRLDLYAPIHKALRNAMSDTLVRVGRMDVADPEDRAEALARLDALLTMCSQHLRHENEFVHTAIEARRPAGSARIADEHAEHLDRIAELRTGADAVAAAGQADAARLAHRLYRHLALFVAENFQHMHVEETVHNAMLWEHYSDAELEELHGRLMASIAPQEQLETARWMLPACTPAERAGMIAAARTQMPPEALLGLLATVRPHIDATGWAKLTAAAGVAADCLA